MSKWNFFLQESRTAPKHSCSNQPEAKWWLFRTERKLEGQKNIYTDPWMRATACCPVVVQRARGAFTTRSRFAAVCDAAPRQR